jgi:hypothetical protein
VAALPIPSEAPPEGIGRAYAFFAGLVRGVPQACLRDFCGISNPHTLFSNFNGDFTSIETAQERSVKRLSNDQARCQMWSLSLSTTNVSFVAGACGAEEHG